MVDVRVVDFDQSSIVDRSQEFVADHSFYSRVLKRFLDCCFVLAAAPIVLPVVVILAFFVALDGGNPFYAQIRIGRNGRIFRMWKLRTMVVDADKRLQSYLAENPEALAQWNSTQKLKNDPRITPVGKLLRKTSLDEFPQFLNVLNGSMSLVGPRPMMVGQRHMYQGSSYYSLRPGITGLWQISERNESEFAARVRYDDDYRKKLSFRTDSKILLSTVAVMCRATGY